MTDIIKLILRPTSDLERTRGSDSYNSPVVMCFVYVPIFIRLFKVVKEDCGFAVFTHTARTLRIKHTAMEPPLL